MSSEDEIGQLRQAYDTLAKRYNELSTAHNRLGNRFASMGRPDYDELRAEVEQLRRQVAEAEKRYEGLRVANRALIDAIENGANPKIAALERRNAALVSELRNIAEANPAKWEADMRDEFQPWAQSRARAALAEAAGKEGDKCDCGACNGSGFIDRDGTTCDCIKFGCKKRHSRDERMPPAAQRRREGGSEDEC